MALKDVPGEKILKSRQIAQTILTLPQPTAMAKEARWGSDRLFDMVMGVPHDFSANRDTSLAADVSTEKSR